MYFFKKNSWKITVHVLNLEDFGELLVLLCIIYYFFYSIGIVSDLFPRMVEETIDYGILEGSIRQCCVKKGLEDVDGEYKQE